VPKRFIGSLLVVDGDKDILRFADSSANTSATRPPESFTTDAGHGSVPNSTSEAWLLN